MSDLVDTRLGQFNCVRDGDIRRWLLECKFCGELLPLTEEHLQGKQPIDHESKNNQGRFCEFRGYHEFGAVLVAAMQTRAMMGYGIFHDRERKEPNENARTCKQE